MSGDSSWVDTLGGCYWHLVAPTGQDATKLPAMRQPPSKELPSPYVSSAEAANLGSGGDTEWKQYSVGQTRGGAERRRRTQEGTHRAECFFHLGVCQPFLIIPVHLPVTPRLCLGAPVSRCMPYSPTGPHTYTTDSPQTGMAPDGLEFTVPFGDWILQYALLPLGWTDSGHLTTQNQAQHQLPILPPDGLLLNPPGMMPRLLPRRSAEPSTTESDQGSTSGTLSISKGYTLKQPSLPSAAQVLSSQQFLLHKPPNDRDHPSSP